MSDITEMLEGALQKQLGDIKLDHVEFTVGEDHDGDQAVFVKGVLAPNAPLIPGQISAAANVAVSDVFLQMDDKRLVYLYLHRPDDERPIEEERAHSDRGR